MGGRSFFLSDFSRAETLVGLGIVVTFVSLFTSWMSYHGLDGVGGTAGAGVLTLLAWLGTLALFAIRSPLLRNTIEVPKLPTTDAVLFAAGGAFELVGLILFYAHYHHHNGIPRTAGFGWYLAIIGSGLTIAGGVIAIRAGQATLHDAVAGGPSPTPPPPPAQQGVPLPSSPSPPGLSPIPAGPTVPAPPPPPGPRPVPAGPTEPAPRQPPVSPQPAPPPPPPPFGGPPV